MVVAIMCRQRRLIGNVCELLQTMHGLKMVEGTSFDALNEYVIKCTYSIYVYICLSFSPYHSQPASRKKANHNLWPVDGCLFNINIGTQTVSVHPI